MKVLENTGTKVTVEFDADEAAKLAGVGGVTAAWPVQDRLQDALDLSWVEAGCPSMEDA